MERGPDKYGDTQLHYAAASGDIALVKALADAETINERNVRGETPVLLAFRNKHLEAGLELVNRGANVDIADHSGKSARDYMPG
jgi:uncharacterized protein